WASSRRSSTRPTNGCSSASASRCRSPPRPAAEAVVGRAREAAPPRSNEPRARSGSDGRAIFRHRRDGMQHSNLDTTEIAVLMERVLYEVKKVVVGQDHFLERV